MRGKTKLGLRLLLLFVAKHEIEATNWKTIVLWAWDREAFRASASSFPLCIVSDQSALLTYIVITNESSSHEHAEISVASLGERDQRDHSMYAAITFPYSYPCYSNF
jgi:hypothetical protein